MKSWGDDIDDGRKRNDAQVPGALSAKTLGRGFGAGARNRDGCMTSPIPCETSNHDHRVNRELHEKPPQWEGRRKAPVFAPNAVSFSLKRKTYVRRRFGVTAASASPDTEGGVWGR